MGHLLGHSCTLHVQQTHIVTYICPIFPLFYLFFSHYQLLRDFSGSFAAKCSDMFTTDSVF